MYFIWRLLLWPFRFVARNFRALLAGLLGYGVMSGVTTAVIAGAYRAWGAEWLVQPESWSVSAGWIAVTMVATIAGAGGGSFLCQLADKTGRGTRLFVCGIVLIGLATLYQAGDVPAVGPREGIPELAEILRHAVSPKWVMALTAALAAISVLAAARCVRRPGQAEYDPAPA